MGMMSKRMSGLGKYTEIWLAALLFAILALLVIPMPVIVIDMLIAVNMTFAIVILLTSMYVTKALDFSVFPAMLLVTTLLRIGLSVASTRLILTNTDDRWHEAGGLANVEAANEAALESSGHVIKAFGEFVVQGSAVIGIVMFLIITVVQFVIVAQGSGRVAEVAARFTLDAMPGKQMALDGEFNNRMITPEEYKAKREELQAESDFFGSMDGAMKFIKGDAMAGIMIVVVNLLGGFIVGGLIGGMGMGNAGATYAVLTIGEGLIAQIPSLLIAVASGLVVTRAASPRNMGSELGRQLIQSPRALAISAVFIGILGLAMPGVKLPLFTMAAIVGGAAWWITRKNTQDSLEDDVLGSGEAAQAEEITSQMLRVDPIALEVGDGPGSLAELANPDGPYGGELLERLKQVRKRVALEFGVIAPGVRVKPHSDLQPGEYQVRIRGDVVARGEVLVDRMLGIGPDLDIPGLDGEPTTDPIYHTPALWVPRSHAALAQQAGLQLFDAQDVVSTHVSEIVKQHLEELLTREEVMELLNMARQEAPTVVQELVPQLLSLGQIRMVLQNLVREQVPIKDLGTILNALADQAYQTKDPFQLTEHVRTALGRKICQRYQNHDSQILAFMLSPDAERQIQGSISLNETGQFLALDPATSDALHQSLMHHIQENRGQMLDPVIVCSPKIRRFVKKLFERAVPKLVVLSYSEVVAGVTINPRGEIGTTPPAG